MKVPLRSTRWMSRSAILCFSTSLALSICLNCPFQRSMLSSNEPPENIIVIRPVPSSPSSGGTENSCSMIRLRGFSIFQASGADSENEPALIVRSPSASAARLVPASNELHNKPTVVSQSKQFKHVFMMKIPDGQGQTRVGQGYIS